MPFFLRVEGVDLRHFIFDTEDLSTRRGGSFLLLQAARDLPARLPHYNLEPISVGASTGIYRLQGADGDKAERARKEVEDFLSGHEAYRHATFVVDVAPGEDQDFAAVREQLIALNRVRQLRQCSVAPAAWSPKTSRLRPCQIDRVRPAEHYEARAPTGKQLQSTSVHVRRQFGRDQKQRFYQEWTAEPGGDNPVGEVLKGIAFVQELEELSDRRGCADAGRDHLNRKVAVMHIDGNGFGKIQTSLCRTVQDQRDWDQRLLGQRRQLLRDLLQTYAKQPADREWFAATQEHRKPPFRLETLLWGGDEIIWIVPAWQGWELLSCFFRQAARWDFRGRPLTHAAGIVFCHHNAPIRRVTRLASELLDQAKRRGRDRSYVAYEALESFDHVGRDLLGYWRERCPKGQSTDGLILDGLAMAAIANQVRRLKALRDEFPLRQLYRAVSQLERGADAHQATDQIRRAVARAEAGTDEAAGGAQKALDALKPLLDPDGREGFLWVHLLRLWDYIV